MVPMTDIAATNPPIALAPAEAIGRPHLDHPIEPLTVIIFLGIIGSALLFVAYSLFGDVAETGAKVTTYLPYLLVFMVLLIALGFEFVNGFHHTSNAVATVIYTHSLPANIGRVCLVALDVACVRKPRRAVAFGIISLLPV